MAGDEKFTVDLDWVLKEHLPTARKDHVVRFLKRNFKQNEHFEVTLPSPELTSLYGRLPNTYLMTVSTSELIKTAYNMKHKYVRQVQDKEVKSILMSVENSTIGFACNALRCTGLEFKRQYRVDKYFVDLYIPELHLCVECDEMNHVNYDIGAETTRQAFIESKLGCKFLRFNPNASDFDLSDVINAILSLFMTKCGVDSHP